MKKLVGRVASSGAIEFPFLQNEWAHQWYHTQLSQRPDSDQHEKWNRILIKPSKFQLEITPPASEQPEQVTWFEQLRPLLDSADQLVLKPGEKSFRLQKATQQVGRSRELVTLGGQLDIEQYAAKHWNRIKYFFAQRYDEFNFNLSKMVSCRDGSSAGRTIELVLRMHRKPDEASALLTFLATGSSAPTEIISWRSTVAQGASGRFSDDELDITCKVTQTRQPLTFLREFREEFNNYGYEFAGDKFNGCLEKIRQQQSADTRV